MGLLSAIAGVAGGISGILNQNDQNRKDRNLSRSQFNDSFRESERQFNFQSEFANKQFEEQKHMARHGVAVRVQDAKNAGINPLAAMGLPTTGGQPVSVGSSPAPSPSPTSSSPANINAVAMGQSLGRSIDALADIAKSAQQQNLIKEPQKVTMAAKDSPSTTPGAAPGIGILRMGRNLFLGTKSEDASQQLEDDFMGNIEHFIMRSWKQPPLSQLPKGRVGWVTLFPNVHYAVTKEQDEFLSRKFNKFIRGPKTRNSKKIRKKIQMMYP